MLLNPYSRVQVAEEGPLQEQHYGRIMSALLPAAELLSREQRLRLERLAVCVLRDHAACGRAGALHTHPAV